MPNLKLISKGDLGTLDIQTKFQTLMYTDIGKKNSAEFISNSMEKRQRALYKIL